MLESLLMRRFALFLYAVAAVCLAFGLTGCGSGQTWATFLAAAFSGLGLLVSACSASHGRLDDGAVITPDAGGDAGGTWGQCCEGGRISTCFCPAGWACNYGWFSVCPDGTCVNGPQIDACFPDAGPPDAGPPDAGPPDAGGEWESCCQDGVITTCLCPFGVECNYGWYENCGNGTCVYPGSTCPPAP